MCERCVNVNTRALHKVLAQKVAEKKAAAEAAAAELATYLKVQAAMTQKLSGQIGTLMAEQDLAQAATSGAVTEVETDDSATQSEDMSDVADSPASTGSAGHPHRLDSPMGHLARRTLFM